MEHEQRRRSEIGFHTRRGINSRSCIWLHVTALLSVSPPVGASRSGKHISGGYLDSLPLDICRYRAALVGHWLQVERAAASEPNFSPRVLVRWDIHGHYDCPLGLVAVLTVAQPVESFSLPGCKRKALTLYTDSRSSLTLREQMLLKSRVRNSEKFLESCSGYRVHPIQ